MMKNNKKSTKKLAIALLALLGVVSTGSTYAYWQGAVLGSSKNATGNIVIGEAGEITTSVTVNDVNADKVLVPSGRVEDAVTQADQVDLDFSITWSNTNSTLSDAIGAGTLSVELLSAEIVDAESHSDLVLVTTPADVSINLNKTVSRTVTVVLDEPADAAAYEAIINRDIVVTLKFSVAVA